MSDNERHKQPLHVKEAATALGVSPVSVRRYVKAGQLPAVRLGEHGRLRVRREDVEAFLKPVGGEVA